MYKTIKHLDMRKRYPNVFLELSSVILQQEIHVGINIVYLEVFALAKFLLSSQKAIFQGYTNVDRLVETNKIANDSYSKKLAEFSE